MTSARQGDLFTPESQSDLFDEDAPTPVFRADPDEVRAELCASISNPRWPGLPRLDLAVARQPFPSPRYPSTTLRAVAPGRNSRAALPENA